MKKIYLLFLLQFFTFVQIALSQKYYVKYSVDDCIRTNGMLHELSSILKDQTVHFILKSEFSSDSALIVKKRGIHNFNYKLIFSDSLYNHYVKGIESYLIVDEDYDIKTYKLKTLDATTAQSLVKNKTTSLQTSVPCLQVMNSDNGYKIYGDDYILSQNSRLGRYTLHDLRHNKHQTIIPDHEWTRLAYQKFYGTENYLERHNFLIMNIEKHPSLDIKVNQGIIKDNNIFFKVTIKFLELIDTTNKVNVKDEHYIYQYSIKDNKLTEIYHLPNTLLEGYYYNENYLHSYGDYFFMLIAHNTFSKDNVCLIKFTLENEQATIKLMPEIKIPETHSKYKIENNYLQIYSDKNLISFILSDEVIDISNQKKYKIPLNDQDHKSIENLMANAYKYINGEIDAPITNHYIVYEVKDKGEQVSVVYRNAQSQILETLFDKSSTSVLKTTILPLDYLSIIGFQYHPLNDKQMVYRVRNQSDPCFKILDIYSTQ